ncbi:sensor histidine kinase [Corallococcus carmarthensis]|uniref:histidine kinase n=1 Tax=Corallococcus carmarthensis TaxID=2316728 RepID=A0A3A8JVK9_9BACT|nr:histidine kinase [Corallococcus carmarthensis]NOK18186.1 histidine kinase [Corallococcus carmarthensis]RKG95830.1 sensor protein lytS [Corallococcus carmarthensis]
MSLRRPWQAWPAAFAYWTLAGLAAASEAHSVGGTGWGHALLTSLTADVLWVPVSIAILQFGLRFPLERRHVASRAALHVAGALVVSFIRAGMIFSLDPWVGWYAQRPGFTDVLKHALLSNPFVYLTVLGVAHALYYADQLRLRETQLARAQLHVLKAQLHPHFLFNTLNSISALVHRDPQGSERMIARLSDLLRGTLEAAGTEEVPLQEELRSLQPYLDIQGVRFADRLTVKQDIAKDALGAHVPHLVLQPLVENAIQHGIAPGSEPGTVTLVARREGPELHLEVRDDGIGLKESPADVSRGARGGRGLRITRERLVQLYGGAHRLELRDAVGGGTTVALAIPFRTEPAP